LYGIDVAYLLEVVKISLPRLINSGRRYNKRRAGHARMAWSQFNEGQKAEVVRTARTVLTP